MGGMNQALAMGLNQINGLKDGVADDDAATVGQVNAAISASGPADGSITNAKLSNMPANTIKANVTGSSAVPTDKTITQVLDALVGSTQGSIAYRNASAWVPLTPGSSGQYLQTGGAGANPSWQTVSIPVQPWTLVKKTADQSITSNVTLTNDTELLFAMAANTTYAFRVVYSVTNGAGGVRVSFNGPASPTRVRLNISGSSSAAGIGSYGTVLVGISGATGTPLVLPFFGMVTNGSTAGNLVMQICQTTSNAAASVFEKGSYLEYAVIA